MASTKARNTEPETAVMRPASTEPGPTADLLNIANDAAVTAPEPDPNPEDLTPTAAKKADAVVSYKGILAVILGPHVRSITAEQWAGAGVEGQETTTWDEGNGYMIPARKFSAQAIKFLIEVEQGFVLETLD